MEAEASGEARHVQRPWGTEGPQEAELEGAGPGGVRRRSVCGGGPSHASSSLQSLTACRVVCMCL